MLHGKRFLGDITSVLWSETLEPEAPGENIKDIAMCQRIKTEEAELKHP